MSDLQTENSYSEGKGEDQYYLPEMQGIFHKKELIISNYFVIFLKNKMFLTEKDGIINLLYNFYVQQVFILPGVKIGYPICTEG